jgi:hypothetical protein
VENPRVLYEWSKPTPTDGVSIYDLINISRREFLEKFLPVFTSLAGGIPPQG